MIFIEINNFPKQNRILWAHMGPNPDRAPTRTGPQPGLGPGVEPCMFDLCFMFFLLLFSLFMLDLL